MAARCACQCTGGITCGVERLDPRRGRRALEGPCGFRERFRYYPPKSAQKDENGTADESTEPFHSKHLLQRMARESTRNPLRGTTFPVAVNLRPLSSIGERIGQANGVPTLILDFSTFPSGRCLGK